MKGTEFLQQEQRTIERVAQACGVLAEMLENGTSVPASVLQSVVKFLRVFCSDYHREHEARLLAMLQMKGFPSEGFPIESLRHEHDKLSLLTNQLGNAIGVHSLKDEKVHPDLYPACARGSVFRSHVERELRAAPHSRRIILSSRSAGSRGCSTHCRATQRQYATMSRM